MLKNHDTERKEINPEKKIAFKLITNEGNKCFTFIQYSMKNREVIFYATIDKPEEFTHSKLFELAQDEHDLESEPVGGGVFDVLNGSYRPSILYGGVDDKIKNAVERKAFVNGC